MRKSKVFAAAKRWAFHKRAISGDQSTERFAKSPYFVGGSDTAWRWDTTKIRVDASTLADAYLSLAEVLR